MTNTDLNKYLKHYIEEDQTQRAIMLSAPWGKGKSYYIQKELVPYLKKKENGSHSCVVVSLYGLKSLQELNKELYFESKAPAKPERKRRFQKVRAISKPIVTGTLGIGKTVLKALTNIDLDFSLDNPNWDKLYSSVDYSSKLIIFEDLERSGIDIQEILAYVNKLVEIDGVKVLLVANEDELIEYVPIEAETQDQQEFHESISKMIDHVNRKYTEATQRYLTAKEKTVGDTIIFGGDFPNAVKQILSKFNKGVFKLFQEDKAVDSIVKLLDNHGITNLRSFLFACQKACDILNSIDLDQNNDIDFINTLFYGVIIYSNMLHRGRKERWTEGKYFSAELSTEQYPLFRFCYDYITCHVIDIEPSKVNETKAALKELRLYDKDKSLGDKDINTLYNWWIQPEKEVKDAILSITQKLQTDKISFYDYGRIAAHSIRAKAVINCNIEKLKELLVKNLYNRGDKIDADYLFLASMVDEKNPDVLAEFKQLQEAMTASLAAKETTIFDFDYQPSSIVALSNAVFSNHGRILRGGAFASRLEIKRIAEMLKSSSAYEIYQLRGVFYELYKLGNIKDFLGGDKDAIAEMMEAMGSLESFEGFDKIQQLQIQRFSDTLNDIHKRL